MGFTNAGLANGGLTDHYQIAYDDAFTPAAGVERAAAVLNAVDGDFAMMAGWFSGVDFQFSLPMQVNIVNALGGASWNDPPSIALPFGYAPTITVMPGPDTDAAFIRYLMVSEVTEMFMASQNAGWFEGAGLFNGADEGSKGEGLSRFLGIQFKVANGLQQVRYESFEVVGIWLNSPDRPNFVDNNPDDHSPDIVTGCTTCFIFYLHSQLGFSIQAIIGAPAATLGGVYTRLTGRTDGWQSFIDCVNTYYPSGLSYDVPGDNLFPVAHLANLGDAQLPAASTVNTRILSLDTQAPAAVTVNLISDNPAVLTVPAQITIPPGQWAAGVELAAAPIIGAARSVTIHANYAGETRSAIVQVLPRASILQGRITDSLGQPLAGAAVLITSSVPIDAFGGESLQLTTDSDGAFQTPVIPPGDYPISASLWGYVPAEAVATVSLGEPVTTQNFTFAATLPFTIGGQVTSLAGSPVAGAGVTLAKVIGNPDALQVTTDANGLYTLSGDPGPYDGEFSISLAADGFVPASFTLIIPNGATLTENCVIIAFGSLSGSIRDTAGTPVAGALVTAGPVSVRADAAGAYSLPGLAPGATDVTVSAPGFDTAAASVMVSSGVDSAEDFALTSATATVTGAVRDTIDLSPLLGARVRVGVRSATTDANGKYTIAGLAAGVLPVTVMAARHHTKQTTAQLIDHQTIELDFNMSPLPHGGLPPQ